MTGAGVILTLGLLVAALASFIRALIVYHGVRSVVMREQGLQPQLVKKMLRKALPTVVSNAFSTFAVLMIPVLVAALLYVSVSFLYAVYTGGMICS